MQVRKMLVLAAVLVGFTGAPFVARAIADEGRDPASASSTTAKHKKKKKKAKKGKAKKHAKKSSSHHPRASKKASSGASVGTHYPTQPGGSGFADIPAEKKDDLPPPSTPPNQ